ncbi:MAG: phosphoribosyltransferase family protein [Bacteriovoracaceae bacterium]
MDINTSIEGKNVLIVEDIVDTGLTIKYLMDLFEQRRPKTLRLVHCFKCEVKHKSQIDYLAYK